MNELNMKEKIFEIINQIREGKDLHPLEKIEDNYKLRDEIGFTSFDLAELTVRIEDIFGVDIFQDGVISTVGEIYVKIS